MKNPFLFKVFGNIYNPPIILRGMKKSKYSFLRTYLSYDERKNFLNTELQKNLTLSEISLKLKMPQRYVRAIIKKHDLIIPPHPKSWQERRKRLTPQILACIEQKIRDGHGFYSIAKKWHIGRYTYNRIKKKILNPQL